MTDCCEITFILGVFEFDLFLGQPIPVDGTDQFLVLLEQTLPEFLRFLVFHFVLSNQKCSETVIVDRKNQDLDESSSFFSKDDFAPAQPLSFSPQQTLFDKSC